MTYGFQIKTLPNRRVGPFDFVDYSFACSATALSALCQLDVRGVGFNLATVHLDSDLRIWTSVDLLTKESGGAIIEIIIGISGATTAASLLVSLFKLGVPSASSALVAAIAFIAGQASSVLVTAAQGGLGLNQKVIAGTVLTGIIAAAAAAGISRTDQSAEKGRTNPPGGDTKPPGV